VAKDYPTVENRSSADGGMLMRAIVALVFAGLALLMAILQVGALISAKRASRSYSLVPFLGAIVGIAACLIAPWKNAVYAIPLFLILDPSPVLFAIAMAKGAFK
jgi:hypothetical protein